MNTIPITKSTIKSLATQLFGHDYHTFYTLSSEFPHTPEAYMCWINECRNPATDLALRNIHGSVIPFFGCKFCCQRLNGVTSDDVPPLKSSLLTTTGIPVKVAA